MPRSLLRRSVCGFGRAGASGERQDKSVDRLVGGRGRLGGLTRRGVRIYFWRGVMMHAKTATVDQLWSTIGSYNFDAQSRFNNLEVTVEILDAATAQTLTASFERDIANAEPFAERAWLRLPWWRKALAWISYRLRRFL